MEIKGRAKPQDVQAVLVYVTVSEQAEAVRIGREVVSQRLAACANIVPKIASVYWWNGELQEDDEALLILKSRAELAAELSSVIAAIHPYDVPAISVIPLSHVHPPYYEWLLEQTAET